jgi:glycosyltransferase 2 family protein
MAASLAYFLLSKLDMAKTFGIIKNADVCMVTASCLAYLASNIFKTLRFRVMLKTYGIPGIDLFTITSYHNFFNQIMPARTGELTFLYYLKNIGGTEMSKGLHILVVTRIFDFIVISAFFICSLLLYFGIQTSAALVAAGVVFFIISVITLFNLKWLIILCGRLFRFMAKKLNLEKKNFAARALGKVDEVVEEFSSFKTGRHTPMLAATSILTWSALYFLFYLTIRSFGIEIDPLQSVAGSTGGVLTNVLPINSFGSFGTLEAGWTGGFVLVGMNEQDAIITGFGYHAISFFASAVIAFLCYIYKKIFSSRRDAETQK